MALARPLPHWGVGLTSKSSMSWWNSWATSWNKHFYSISFLSISSLPRKLFSHRILGNFCNRHSLWKSTPPLRELLPRERCLLLGIALTSLPKQLPSCWVTVLELTPQLLAQAAGCPTWNFPVIPWPTTVSTKTILWSKFCNYVQH